MSSIMIDIVAFIIGLEERYFDKRTLMILAKKEFIA